MALIQQYNFKDTPNGDFTIIAPVKHASRWLSSMCSNRQEVDVGMDNKWKGSLETIMFSDKESEFSSKKIKVKSYKKEIVIPKPYFVYRDPYEWFISSIRTGASVYQHNHIKNGWIGWNGKLENIDILMTNNGHYRYNYWRIIYDLIKDYDRDEIELIALEDLSSFIHIQTLYYYPFDKEAFSFSSEYTFDGILGNITIDVVEECKKCNPRLWDNFMIQIEKETEVLNLLIEKLKWIK
jgi:hypothetical protein